MGSAVAKVCHLKPHKPCKRGEEIALNPEQRKVVTKIIAQGKRQGASRKQLKAAIETGLVEANLTNPRGGDGTSAGWRQEINTYGPVSKRTNIRGAAKRFFSEAKQHDAPGTPSGVLAQKVQRSAYPDRYGQRSHDAGQILRKFGGGASRNSPKGGVEAPTDNKKERALSFLHTLQSGGDVTKFFNQEQRASAPDRGTSESKAINKTSLYERRAQKFEKKHLPYKWGGGHDRKGGAIRPVDCSGAVSRVLGINPRVAGAMGSVGRSGKGGRVEVYYNGHHTFMKINGRFFGTSQSNPGGGAGWIDSKHVSSDYLKGFKVRSID